MLLFGHRFIQSEEFFHIFDIDTLEKTPPSAKIYLDFSEKNLDIIEHLRCNQIDFALGVTDINTLVYAAALGASYIMVSQDFAKSAQSIAENYLFDAKILVHIKEEREIEEMALLGIDGVVFPEAIVKVSS
ncbi:MAG TPA: hypothetical protein ENJ67_01245 [Sulfurimonas autotrophica]|uniref:Uncharacterized protein n=1 Tax=Sulfurimonas autotrophica TaxID=202747 RepID=A0A7C3FXG0_9BACT|nr:hypothetical protein [Sulfurimonas autotrophica]